MFAGMGKRGPKIVLAGAIAMEGIKIEKELYATIGAIVDSILKEERIIYNELIAYDKPPYSDIDKLAWIADLKIQLKLVKTIKASILRILKRSSNRLILASVELESRLS